MNCAQKINLSILLGLVAIQLVAAAPGGLVRLTKAFSYQGALPIKDDLLIKSEANETSTMTPQQLSEAEEACWKLINEQSVVTFALQNRVLDELKNDLKKITVTPELQASIDKVTNRMRKNMNDALDALKRDAADEFFDSLFESSEDIIHFSALIRDPKLSDEVFLVLVKAVSRLGRHNSALIQEFTTMCSLIQRSPKPRSLTASN